MISFKAIKEPRKLMKKFKTKGVLIALPKAELYFLDFKTGKTTKLPDGKELFDK